MKLDLACHIGEKGGEPLLHARGNVEKYHKEPSFYALRTKKNLPASLMPLTSSAR